MHDAAVWYLRAGDGLHAHAAGLAVVATALEAPLQARPAPGCAGFEHHYGRDPARLGFVERCRPAQLNGQDQPLAAGEFCNA